MITEHVHSQFRSILLSPAFPCVLGRSAFNNNSYRFGFYRNMTGQQSVQGLCHDLYEFVREQPLHYDFSSFIAVFRDPQPTSEQEYEDLLWTLLQALHDNDKEAGNDWDPTTKPDPENPGFSFSFAGRSYFIVGLHALSSRLSRKFIYPAVVFNAHYQFEALRTQGKFEHFQKVIRSNDIRLQENINPNLTNYGEESEAKQYSGRAVEKNWKCPFQP